MTLKVLVVLPELLNVNGDAENARVLARRAEWAGLQCDVITSSREGADIVVIGSGFDAELSGTRRQLDTFAGALIRCKSDGVPILAIGTGMELLCERIELPAGSVEGLGILPGEARMAEERINGDLVVDSRFGVLVGYENHARNYRLPDPSLALGTVIHGAGNGAEFRVEGIVNDSVYGSHMHGPILAKNPVLADHLLALACGGAYRAPNVGAGQADTLAQLARERVLKRAGIALSRQSQTRSL